MPLQSEKRGREERTKEEMEKEEERKRRRQKERKRELNHKAHFFKAVGLISGSFSKARSVPKHEIGIAPPLGRNRGSAPESKGLHKSPGSLSCQA